MFSIFKKKIIVPHVRLTGVIGILGRFRQGMDLASQQDILKKAFSLKKISHVAISINSPGGSPVQSHLIYSFIRALADKKKVKVSSKIAQAVQSKYNSMKKPADKEKFQNRISKSYKDLLSALKEQLEEQSKGLYYNINKKCSYEVMCLCDYIFLKYFYIFMMWVYKKHFFTFILYRFS